MAPKPILNQNSGDAVGKLPAQNKPKQSFVSLISFDHAYLKCLVNVSLFLDISGSSFNTVYNISFIWDICMLFKYTNTMLHFNLNIFPLRILTIIAKLFKAAFRKLESLGKKRWTGVTANQQHLTVSLLSGGASCQTYAHNQSNAETTLFVPVFCAVPPGSNINFFEEVIFWRSLKFLHDNSTFPQVRKVFEQEL